MIFPIYAYRVTCVAPMNRKVGPFPFLILYKLARSLICKNIIQQNKNISNINRIL